MSIISTSIQNIAAALNASDKSDWVNTSYLITMTGKLIRPTSFVYFFINSFKVFLLLSLESVRLSGKVDGVLFHRNVHYIFLCMRCRKYNDRTVSVEVEGKFPY